MRRALLILAVITGLVSTTPGTAFAGNTTVFNDSYTRSITIKEAYKSYTLSPRRTSLAQHHLGDVDTLVAPCFMYQIDYGTWRRGAGSVGIPSTAKVVHAKPYAC